MNENYAVDRELGWDDTIENDSPDFILLPEGEYDFVVDHFDRERHNGSEKLPPCGKAVIYLRIDTPQGPAIVRHNLFLHTRTEGMICAFFTAIGQRQHGQRIQMNWAAVPGARGRAKIGIREYNGKQYNEVKKFLEPAAPAAPAYQAAAPATPYQAPASPAPYTPQQQSFTPPAYNGNASGSYTPGRF